MSTLSQPFNPAPAREAANEPAVRAICESLVAGGNLDAADADRALQLQAEQDRHELIGQILVKLGLVSEYDLADKLAELLEVPLVLQADFAGSCVGDTVFAPAFLKQKRILVQEETDNEVTVVMAEPQDADVLHALGLCSGKTIRACLGIPSEIERALGGDRIASESGAGTAVTMRFQDDVEQLKELAGEAPVVKLVNRIIRDAAESGASDVHIEPFEDRLQVRYRVDGMLREIESPPAQFTAAVISRIKIMANLNIAERRLSQDGRFRQRVRGNEFDVRVSTAPTMYGESVVLRLLQRDGRVLDFDALGFSPDQAATMHEILARPNGILLVTGPTGSGKSTTLYAALRHLNDPQRMIITVEDPVEYHIEGINQMQVRPQIDLTFANALRSIVRQDPDVIMIGEMRDTETARIAVQSALTGHLVLSTLHTNDAPGSIMRLLDMGVEDYLLTSAVNAIQAQRLVRTLCSVCSEPYDPVDELVERFALHRFAGGEPVTLRRAVGCTSCDRTGYTGRSAIIEILRITDDIRPLILKRCDAGELARAAREQGMVPMLDDGLYKASAGFTTIEEVLRVAPVSGNTGGDSQC